MTKGLLIVTMEPPAAFEDEFNDWYDTEHFPQRRALPAFQSASRWVCLTGWPRWLALYDMETPAAVETPAYHAVSGANSTPWSKRVLSRTIGRERIVCRQRLPGDAVGCDADRVGRLVAACYPGMPADGELDALHARAGARPGLLQWRVFERIEAPQTWVIAAFDRPAAPASDLDAFAACGELGARSVNMYVPYRRGP
jgi:hypothetical protein